MNTSRWFLASLGLASLAALAMAGDWPQFRGPESTGKLKDASAPIKWSSDQGITWKTKLPGPGSSSPIIIGDRIFVTCYNGYGTDTKSPGELKNLKRWLLCLNKKDGQMIWSVEVGAALPEDQFQGFITEHGYASSTPVSDGTNVYVFFGKSGVLAYDLDGKKLWQTNVGKQSDKRRWGSASSPILYENMVIVNAASESRTIWALDKKTGKSIWKLEVPKLDSSYSTPVLVKTPEGKIEIAVSMPDEVIGIDPTNGKKLWYVEAPMKGNVSPSLIAHEGVVYGTGGFQGKGMIAIKAGGSGNVTSSHVLWNIRESSYVPTPVLVDQHLYWLNESGVAFCVEAATGKVVYNQRVNLQARGGRTVYASPIVVDGRIYAPTRRSGVVVYQAAPKFEQLATNKLDDDTDFNATPAVNGKQLFLRSNHYLYCLSTE